MTDFVSEYPQHSEIYALIEAEILRNGGIEYERAERGKRVRYRTPLRLGEPAPKPGESGHNPLWRQPYQVGGIDFKKGSLDLLLVFDTQPTPPQFNRWPTNDRFVVHKFIANERGPLDPAICDAIEESIRIVKGLS